MKIYNASELKEILSAHREWLNSNGLKGSRADLSNADLSNADLRHADLSNADLRNTDLRNTDLRYADLRYADLRHADLRDAILRYADLRHADLRHADLSNADLSNADLSNADLRNTDLRHADLSDANLSDAILENIKNMPCFQIVPELGPFYAFKKLQNDVIATLYIPRSAKRVNSTGRKCRVEKAKVVALSNGKTREFGLHDPNFCYKVGSWVKPDFFNDDIRETCTNGIHCFITRKEAEEYN